MMKRNAKLLSVCSLLLAAVLSVGILAGCDSSDHNTDGDEDGEKEKTTTVTTTGSGATTTTSSESGATTTTSSGSGATVTTSSGTVDIPDSTAMKVAGSKDGVYTFRVPMSWTVTVNSDEMTMATTEDSSVAALFQVQENTERFSSSAEAAQQAKTVYDQVYGNVDELVDSKLGGVDSANLTMTDGDGITTTMVICLKDDQVYILTVASNNKDAVNTACKQIQDAFTFD
ncbi:MAG: hypothetical protein ACI3XR_03510 [Eubacteriales bacterium]